MSRLLVDTHVWLWLQADPERLPDTVRDLVEDRRVELLLSAASAWEIAIKYRIGKLPLPQDPVTYVPDRMRRSGTTTLSVQHAHVLRVSELPDHHRDPFDRLLVAQAQILDVPIVTADSQFQRYEVTIIQA
ncbi:MAG: type II toxin-antitoxin system VapC family toxin [Actinomycetota bacterium]|nr:type II toxin-antitoxin system VapC family toxin [Actinomycetota bacterium]